MMKILVPKKIAQRIIEGLKKAGNQEIGGILMGEHIEAEIYRVKDITLQRRSGSFTWFVRTIESIVAPLSRFFRDTGERFTKFNYLGEWHSHPNSPAVSSAIDRATMRDLLLDPKSTANFLVLIIVRLTATNYLEISAQTFLSSGHQISCEVQLDRTGGAVS